MDNELTAVIVSQQEEGFKLTKANQIQLSVRAGYTPCYGVPYAFAFTVFT